MSCGCDWSGLILMPLLPSTEPVQGIMHVVCFRPCSSQVCITATNSCKTFIPRSLANLLPARFGWWEALVGAKGRARVCLYLSLCVENYNWQCLLPASSSCRTTSLSAVQVAAKGPLFHPGSSSFNTPPLLVPPTLGIFCCCCKFPVASLFFACLPFQLILYHCHWSFVFSSGC